MDADPVECDPEQLEQWKPDPNAFKTVEQAIEDYLAEKRGILDAHQESTNLTIQKPENREIGSGNHHSSVSIPDHSASPSSFGWPGKPEPWPRSDERSASIQRKSACGSRWRRTSRSRQASAGRRRRSSRCAPDWERKAGPSRRGSYSRPGTRCSTSFQSMQTKAPQ